MFDAISVTAAAEALNAQEKGKDADKAVQRVNTQFGPKYQKLVDLVVQKVKNTPSCGENAVDMM